MKDLKDKIGQPIEVGSILAYGHALGRCAGIRIGKVIDIYERKATWGSGKETIVKVWGIDDEWSSQKPRLCERAGHLQFPERMVVLDEHLLPELYRNLLAPVTGDYKPKAKKAA